MSEELLFNSLDRPVPPLRSDVQTIPIPHNGNTVLYFYDTMGYAPSDFSLAAAVEPLLSLINGSFSINKIVGLTEGRVDAQDLLDFVRLLDQNRLLDSNYFRSASADIEEQFEKASLRKPALAGSAYPAVKSELQVHLERLFSEPPMNGEVVNGEMNSAEPPERALYAPHIDPEVGSDVYVRAFSSLKHLTPERVVILATAHYAGYYPGIYDDRPFIGSAKTYELPHGSIETDREYLERLKTSADQTGFTLNDRAHRIEHSIELHLLFARHIWKHDFRIVPILIQSFDEVMYLPEGERGRQLSHFAEHLRKLDDPDTFYLISGDLSHVGRKFGDQEAASSMRSRVEAFDDQFLTAAASGERENLFELIRQNHDRYRVCGFPPLYTFLTAFGGLKGNRMDYSWWDESERESAVSFGAISW